MNLGTSGINICLEKERKCEDQLAANESTMWTPWEALEGSLCVPCGSVQRVLLMVGWAGGDLRCPQARQLNHSGETSWKQGWERQEVLQYYQEIHLLWYYVPLI